MDEPTNATILAVDDDEVSRKILERVLTHAGFRVFTANSGMSALELLSQIEPSLILLDVMMPGMDGYELCAELRANEGTANIPVVFITALDEQQDKARGFALGAVDYVTKPIEPKTLTRVVAAQLQTGLRWEKLSEHRNSMRGATNVVPADFRQFKLFLSQQYTLNAEAEKTCAALMPADLYAGLSQCGMSENQVALSIANFMKLSYMPSIKPEDLQMGILPPPFASANLAVAVARDGKSMFALANPFDRGLIEALTKFSGLGDQFALAITAPKNIKSLFAAAAPARPQQPTLKDRGSAGGIAVLKPNPMRLADSVGAAAGPGARRGWSAAAEGNLAVANLDGLPRDARLETESVLQLAERLLSRAVAERASDIHVEPKNQETVIRLRVDGACARFPRLKAMPA